MTNKNTLIAFVLALLPLAASANNEACKVDLSNKFEVSQGVAADLCNLNSVFIQTCMNEQSNILQTNDFDELSGICIDLLGAEAKKSGSFPGQF